MYTLLHSHRPSRPSSRQTHDIEVGSPEPRVSEVTIEVLYDDYLKTPISSPSSQATTARPRSNRPRPNRVTTPAPTPIPTPTPTPSNSQRSFRETVNLEKYRAVQLRNSQATANHKLRIEATKAALQFATKALPYGAGNIAADISKSGGLSVPKNAQAQEEWLYDRKKGMKSRKKYKDPIANVQRIADAAAKYGAGNCVDNAAVTFTFLCGLAQKAAPNNSFNNGVSSITPSSEIEDEMYAAQISRVATKDRIHHYTVIGDWKNDPENSYIVDSWYPNAQVGLKFSDAVSLKDVYDLTIKKPYSATVYNVMGEKPKKLHDIKQPEIGTFPDKPAPRGLLAAMKATLEHDYYETTRRTLPLTEMSKAPEFVARDMYANDPAGADASIRRAMIRWKLLGKR